MQSSDPQDSKNQVQIEDSKIYLKQQRDEIDDIISKFRKELEAKNAEVDYKLSVNSLYNIPNVIQEVIVGNFFIACLSFLALYVFLNQFNSVLEAGFKVFHFREVFPDFDIRFLTLFVSLATIISASVTRSRKESMQILEERLATKATADVIRKIGDLQDDVYSLRQLFYKQQDELSSTKSDVATLKTDVATLKTDVATLKTDVATLKTDVSSLTIKMSRVLEILESRN
jgi:hypothetical protein